VPLGKHDNVEEIGETADHLFDIAGFRGNKNVSKVVSRIRAHEKRQLNVGLV
jgi:hypothetical protein